MLKKLVEKHGIFNPEVEGGEIRDKLSEAFPEWRFKTHRDKGGAFAIQGKRGMHRVNVLRSKSGHFSVSRDVGTIHTILTLGVAYVVGEVTGIKHQAAVQTFLRNQYHISQ